MKTLEEDDNIYNNAQSEQAFSTTITFKELLWLCLSRWYLFVLALAISCGCAVYYIKKTPKVYVSSAKLLIKDNAYSSQGNEVQQVFSEVSGFNTNTNINNEVVKIKSPIIMREVVEGLGLDIDYTVNAGLRYITLFGTTQPITLKFIDLGENAPAMLRAYYKGDGTVEFGPFSDRIADNFDGLSSADNFSVVLNEVNGDTLATPLGRMIVSKNVTFKGDSTASIDMKVNHIGVAAATGRALGTLTTEIPDNYASVIDISVKDVNPERANAILNGVIEVYNKNWVIDRNQISISTNNFIAERLSVIEHELGEVDDRAAQQQSQTGAPNLETAVSTAYGKTLEIQNKISEERYQVTLARQVRDFLSNRDTQFDALIIPSGLNVSGLSELVSTYNTRLIDRNKLAENSTTNPVVQSIDKELSEMRSNLLVWINTFITNTNNNISHLEGLLAAESAKVAATPAQAIKILDNERQQKVKEEIYLYLLQKREENELSQAFAPYNCQIISPPTASGPVSPDEKSIMLTAILIGLAVPAALIYIVEMSNSKVRGRRDIRKLSVPFIGEIPEANGKRNIFSRIFGRLFRKHRHHDPEHNVKVYQGGTNVINEAFRVIRTNLEFMTPMASDESHVVMITSANPGSGKTFITLNLGIALALKHKRVALIDLDLRRASLSEIAGQPEQGLSNYLAKNASIDDIVIHNVLGNENVDLYPVGPIPPNPAELLYSARLPKLIEQLRHEYDYVLIDCPPAEIVADAKIINRMVDLTLFVIRAGVLERNMLGDIQRFYDQKRYTQMAIILNGTIDPSQSMLYRGNRYGYGYGYGYGYVKSKKKHKSKS